MLVLLIIFLITIPVVSHTVPVELPTETMNPLQTKPDSIVIAVNKDGDLYWNEKLVPKRDARCATEGRVGEAAATRGACARRPEHALRVIGRVVTACERAGISKVAFITEAARARG